MFTILGLATAAAAAMLVGIAPMGTPAVSAELKFASFVSGRHVMNRRVFEPWAKEVARLTGGALTVKMYYDGVLGEGGTEQFQRAVDGVADITWGQQGYTATRFRRTSLIELQGVGDSPVDATKRIWKVFDRHLASEYDGVKVIAIWALDAPIIHTKLKRVSKAGDLRDIRIRAPSQYQAWLLGALGATLVPMPASMLYNSLDRRELDGVLISPSAVDDFKLDEVTKFHIVGFAWGRSPLFAVMNKKSYSGLPKAQRDIIDRTSGLPLSIKASQVYAEEGAKGLKSLGADGRRWNIRISAAEAAKANAMLKEAEADIIARVKQEGIDLTPTLNALRGTGS